MLQRYLKRWNARVNVPESIKKSFKTFIGYEFEVIKKDECLLLSSSTSEDLLAVLTNHNLLCKQDGSVFAEFVSIPLEPSECVAHIKKTASILSSDFPYFDAWKGGKCGLHLHINRKSVKNKKNLLTFFLNNKKYFETLSGRLNTYYCSFSAYDIERNFNSPKYASRYVALNFKNKSTIEFRLWRGTLNPDTLEMYVRITSALGKLSQYLPNLTISEFLFLCRCDFQIESKLEANICNLLTCEEIEEVKHEMDRLDFIFRLKHIKRDIRNLLRIKKEQEDIKRLQERISDPLELLQTTSNF